MNPSCISCLKALLTSLNLLCWLCSAFVIALGEFQMMHSKFPTLTTSFWPIYPSNTLVVTGTIAACVCYIGVLGGMRENRCMLITFFILLFILMLVELAMALVFLVYSRKVDDYMQNDLEQSLKVYMMSSDGDNKSLKGELDAVQHLFRCCGVHGAADWKDKVPISCCVEDPCNGANTSNWPEGCLGKVRDWFSGNFLSTGAGVITMFIIQFICVCVTIPLFGYMGARGLGYQ